MEEKEAAMSGQKTPDNKEEKFDINKVSREELVNIVTQLNQQLQMSYGQINELKNRLIQIDSMEARLHYLFKVLENRNAFGDPEYIISVCDEIKEILTIKDDEEKKEEK